MNARKVAAPRKRLEEATAFGGIDADVDALLDSCFQDHEAYQDAVGHKRFLVIGRKGSGKTAIFRKLVKARSYDVFSFGHTFADYPWAHHQLQGAHGVPEEQRYSHSWQYLMLMTVSKILLNQDQSQPWSESAASALEALESFVVDSYGSRDPDVTQLFTPQKKLRINPHLNLGSIVGVGLDLEKLPVSELPRVFPEVNRTMMAKAIECLNPELNYYVCFDELDRGFDPEEKTYVQMLIGLILAAKAVNRAAAAAERRLSIVVFLRDDIYHLLKFEDKNKITENLVSRIEWDSSRVKWTLRMLMERRFGEVLLGDGTLAWEEVFDEDQEMPSRQKKYRHILDRTFCRPRDIIKFCNEVLAEFKKRGGKESKFANEDIINARQAYSEYLLRELEDEIHKHLPQYEDYIELVKSVGVLQFDIGTFAEQVKRHPGLASGARPIDVLRELFNFSIVGYRRTGGIGGGSEYVWMYLEPTARFDETAASFRVHPGFMEAFGLKKWRKP